MLLSSLRTRCTSVVSQPDEWTVSRRKRCHSVTVVDCGQPSGCGHDRGSHQLIDLLSSSVPHGQLRGRSTRLKSCVALHGFLVMFFEVAREYMYFSLLAYPRHSSFALPDSRQCTGYPAFRCSICNTSSLCVPASSNVSAT